MVIYTKKGQKILIDASDYPIVSQYTWHVDRWGYARTSIYEGAGYQMALKLHHLINGQPIKGFVTDHINRIKLDNRRVNLRVCTYSQNTLNRTWPETATLYGVGVTKKENGRYHANIYTNGKKKYLGSFTTPEEARQVYDEAKSKLQIGLLTIVRRM